MIFYDPLTKKEGAMYYPVGIEQKDLTVDKIIEASKKFIGQWQKPIAKSEPMPDNQGKAH